MIRFAAILIAGLILTGCAGDPLRDVPRLSDTDVSDAEIQAALRGDPDGDADAPEPEPQARGLLGRLFGGAAPTPQATDPLADTDPGTADMPPEAEGEDSVTDDLEVMPDAASAVATAAAPRRGLLGFLSRAAETAQSGDGVEVAAVPPQTRTDARPATPALAPDPDAPDYQVVAAGTVLPYGVLARVCDVPDRQLGTRVERYPEQGGTYALYDSEPGNTAPHTFYLTGFDDGCARQFTAALALFGSPETHEQLRYGLPSKVQPYSTTDAAYETLKSRVCRVGKGKPCGSAMPRLARDTTFVSVYETFGSNPEWKTILLHDGQVIETDIRSN